jgi:hypothetical protein
MCCSFQFYFNLQNPIFWDITPCRPLKLNDVFVEPVASIFRVEKYAKQETSEKAGSIYFVSLRQVPSQDLHS